MKTSPITYPAIDNASQTSPLSSLLQRLEARISAPPPLTVDEARRLVEGYLGDQPHRGPLLMSRLSRNPWSLACFQKTPEELAQRADRFFPIAAAIADHLDRLQKRPAREWERAASADTLAPADQASPSHVVTAPGPQPSAPLSPPTRACVSAAEDETAALLRQMPRNWSDAQKARGVQERLGQRMGASLRERERLAAEYAAEHRAVLQNREAAVAMVSAEELAAQEEMLEAFARAQVGRHHS